MAIAATATVALIGCGGTSRPALVAGAVPPPPKNASPCPPAGGQAELLSRLARGGVTVTAAAGSKMQPLFGSSAIVCWMKAEDGAFEVAFFHDSAVAAAQRICETVSGPRYLYQLHGQTIDASYRLYWQVAGNALLETGSTSQDASFKRILGGTTPPC